MRIYAENEELAKILGDAIGVQSNSIHTDEIDWPIVSSSLIIISSITNDTLYELLKMTISYVDRDIRIGIVKEEWSNGDEDMIDRWIRGEYSRIHNDNEDNMKKISCLPCDRWRDDRMNQLMNNRTIPMCQYSTFTLSNSLKSEIGQFFCEGGSPSCIQEPYTECSRNKPPNLHWTPNSLEGDIEITLRIKFSLIIPERSIISNLSKSSIPYFSTIYEWTDGVLLSNEGIRVHVQRIEHSTIDISGRICYEEQEDPSIASSLLWPMISFVSKQIFSSISNLIFHCDIVLIGSPLFDSYLHNRVFDLTTFMNTASKYGKVGFKHKGEVHNVALNILFPNGVPRSIDELFSLSDNIERLHIGPSPIPSPSTLSLPHSHNKGRRVSFGAIRTLGNNPSTVDQYLDNMVQQTIDYVHL